MPGGAEKAGPALLDGLGRIARHRATLAPPHRIAGVQGHDEEVPLVQRRGARPIGAAERQTHLTDLDAVDRELGMRHQRRW